ncbi:MAG: hypothetical protein ACU85U_01510 [Gammaproteobacteria bacterium]|jgi:hypothetical protein
MESETIKVRLENGQTIDAVIYQKTAGKIEVVLGEGVHSFKCELTPTRNGLAYAGSLKGREIIYERTRDEVQADLDRVDPSLRQSRPR